MIEFILKAVVAGILIATVSTVAQRNITWAAILMGLPMASIISMIFMHYNGINTEQFVQFSYETILFVTISFAMFVTFAIGLPYFGFWWSLIAGMAITIMAYNLALELMK